MTKHKLETYVPFFCGGVILLLKLKILLATQRVVFANLTFVITLLAGGWKQVTRTLAGISQKIIIKAHFVKNKEGLHEKPFGNCSS